MNHHRPSAIMLILPLTVLFLSACGMAPSPTGEIKGTVTSNGIPVANTKMELLRLGDGTQGVLTDAKGRFVFENVMPGDYMLHTSVAARSFGIFSTTSKPCDLKMYLGIKAGDRLTKDLEYADFANGSDRGGDYFLICP
jgi:hypothetical protein